MDLRRATEGKLLPLRRHVSESRPITENELAEKGYAAFACSLTAFSIPGAAFAKSSAFMTGENFTRAL